jgi:ubiquinone/menaquinone biosynthesis C-methylase UbiE
MSTPYDRYDYISYWKGRNYEHQSEAIAIRSFLKKIKRIKNLVEIGCGFGRLTPLYAFRAKKVVLVDPSAKILSQARKRLQKDFKNIEFIQSKIENLPKKIGTRKFNLVIIVRVIHHLKDLDIAFKTINKLTEKDGFLIIEFANKIHWKSVFLNAYKGNFNYYKETNPVNRSTNSDSSIPFLNYHPKMIEEYLQKNSFKIIETRSVSNARSTFLKKYIPISLLIWIEKYIQIPLGKLYFGPSIFILSRKLG